VGQSDCQLRAALQPQLLQALQSSEGAQTEARRGQECSPRYCSLVTAVRGLMLLMELQL
jgi:hypothetical protein